MSIDHVHLIDSIYCFVSAPGNSRRLDFYCLAVRCGKEVESIYGRNDVLPTPTYTR